MNTIKYNWILYLISATILTTIAVQFYWNYKNYEENKQLIINEIQLSLDNSIENYFTDLSKNNFLTIVESDKNNQDKNKIFSNFFTSDSSKKDSSNFKIQSLEIKTDTESAFLEMKSMFVDSLVSKVDADLRKKLKDSFPKIKAFTQLSDSNMAVHVDATKNTISKVKVFKGRKATDSLKLIKGLQTIFIALKQDSLDYNKIDSLLLTELKQKKITIAYEFDHFKDDTLYFEYTNRENAKNDYTAISKSTYFNNRERLEMNYSNPTLETLKRSSTGILLSLLLSLAVISSLFYLLKIIKHQKQLSEIKNDLISNITHEFKTPIATIGVAIESIKNFNVLENKEKTKSYLDVSNEQLSKLNVMVEKLLETASLDSNSLQLNKEEINSVELLKALVEKHKIYIENKTINFNAFADIILTKIDVFHFENAINNIIDNAIKYGGDTVSIDIKQVDKAIQISISDNGNSLTKSNKDRIFEKFYRIPKGNTHDVKGFGIGLYYAKTIVEKHGGTINLDLKNKLTSFIILLPNE